MGASFLREERGVPLKILFEVCFLLQLQMAYVGTAEPLGAGRCRFLMSCAHMETQTSGAAMCCARQASPSEPIRGPGAPRGSAAQPASRDKLFMTKLFVV